MNTGSINDNFNKGQALADKTADTVQSGIRTAKTAATEAADKFSDSVGKAKNRLGATMDNAADEAKSIASKARESLSAATDTVRARVSDVGDSVVSYTKDNPVKALLLSAAVGVVIGALATTLVRVRD